jgi:hypothetical protein
MAIPWQDHLLQEQYQDLSKYVEDDARIKPTTDLMIPIGPSIWIVEEEGEDTERMEEESSLASRLSNSTFPSWKSTAPGARHTVIVGLRGAGGAWVWNPQGMPSKELQVELQARCGGVRHIMSPNKYHVGKYFREWSKAYPQAKVYAPPDYDFEAEAAKHKYDEQEITSHSTKHLQNKPLTIDFVLTEDPKRDYVLDIDQVIFRGSRTDEVVFFHRLSNTVLFCDLLQQVPKENTGLGGGSWFSSILETVAPIAANVPAGAPQPPTPSNSMQYPYMVPYTWQLSFWWKGEQELAGKAWKMIQEKWNPQQIVMSRGEVVKENASQVLTQAFAWVPPLPDMPAERKVEKEALGGFVRGTFSTGPSEGVVEEGNAKKEEESNMEDEKSEMNKKKPPMAMPKPTPAPEKPPVEEKLLMTTTPAEKSEEMAKPPPASIQSTQDAGDEMMG